jgi:hypothetical protein
MSTEKSQFKYVAKAFGEAELAFQGAAWVNDYAYAQPETVQARALEIKKEIGVITEKDIDAIVAEVMAKYLAAGISPSAVEQLKSTLMGNVGASKTQLSQIRDSARMSADAIASESDQATGETASEKQARLLAELAAIRAELKKDVGEAEKIGLLNKEDVKAMNKEDALLDAYLKMTDGPEKEAAYKELLKQAELNDKNIEEKLENPNLRPEHRALLMKIKEERETMQNKMAEFAEKKELPSIKAEETSKKLEGHEVSNADFDDLGELPVPSAPSHTKDMTSSRNV